MVYHYEAIELLSLGEEKSKIIRLAICTILHTFGLTLFGLKPGNK